MQAPLVIVAAFWSTVNEQVAGDVTTLTYSTAHFIALAVIGLLLAVGGGLAVWRFFKFSWRGRGYLAYLACGGGLVLMVMPIYLFGHSVVLTPTQMEVKTLGAPEIVPLANVVAIETREVRGRRSTTTYYDFKLRDGSIKEFTGALVAAAVDKVRSQLLKATQAAAAPPATAAPPAGEAQASVSDKSVAEQSAANSADAEAVVSNTAVAENEPTPAPPSNAPAPNADPGAKPVATKQAGNENGEPTMRTWTDSTGKHKVEARLLVVDGDKVRLRRHDGKEVSMPIARFSPADQEYIRAEEKKAAPIGK